MKNAIKEYLDLSEAKKKTIWGKATFVFDTNILLNLYRYTENTRRALLDSIKKLNGRIWIPYQIAYEFMKDRPTVIFDTEHRYDELTDDGKSFIKKIQQNLRLPEDDSSLKDLHKKINDWISERKKNDLSVTHPSEDKLLNEILTLFEGKVGKKPNDEELKKIIDEGKERYAKKIPPGYKDNEKSKREDNSEYGDLLAWKETIAFSKENKTDIIYVTNDQKEDWWDIVHGKTLGPRVELKREFFEETSQIFLLYTMENFISYMSKGGPKIPEAIIEEIKVTEPRYIRIERQQPNNIVTVNTLDQISSIDSEIAEINSAIHRNTMKIRELQAEQKKAFAFGTTRQINELNIGIRRLERRLFWLYRERDRLLHDSNNIPPTFI